MRGWIAVVALLVVKVVSHVAVLFPISVQVGIATIPYLMQNDRILYSAIFEHRPPLPAFVVALTSQLTGFDVFLTARILHLGVILAAMILVYTLVRQLKGSQLAGVLAVLYFAALESVYANIIFYYDVIAGSVLILAVLLLTSRRSGLLWFWGAGLAFGVTLLVKPQAVVALIVAMLWLLWNRRETRQGWTGVYTFSFGVLLPITLLLGLYALSGLLDEFVFWNVTFNLRYDGGADGSITGDLLRRILITHVWIAPFVAFAVRESNRRQLLLVAGIALAAMAFHIPRSGDIHSAAVLPLLSVQTGIVLDYLIRHLPRWRAEHVEAGIGHAMAAAVLAGCFLNVTTSYVPTPAGFGKVIGLDDVREPAVWVRDHAASGDSLEVIPATDSTAQIVPLSGLLPSGTWVVWNPWGLSPPLVSDTLRREWTTDPPTWIVFFPDLLESTTTEEVRAVFASIADRYERVNQFEKLPFYGRAEILHLR